ncbi:MAG: ADP-forming succinate--CoA ligase subunit beta [Lachnospiraceae bacterium]|nr:ADP-forming succinate--CoA ligase subunit beta [Lachnospiraceae bacterium]
MKLLEYKAKELFDKYDVSTMNGCVIDSSENMEAEIGKAGLSYPVVVKAQVQIGGRGKAGGIRFADTPEEAKKHCEDLLFSELRGYKVNQLLIVEKAENNKTELYLSIMLDRLTEGAIIVVGANGGMEIEQTAKEDPDKIVKVVVDPFVGIKDYMAAYLLSKSGVSMSYKKQLTDMLKKLYAIFMDYSCMLVEINPLVIDANDRLVALDGKIDIDDSAMFRLPDIQEFAAKLQPDNPLINEAAEYNFLYIPVEEGGTIAVTSNGSGMLMSCIDLISKEGMKVAAALDLGGGATADRIKEAMRILFSTPGVKAVLINIFGGITRCDEVAGGVKMALEGQHQDKIVVIRMEGTNKEAGLQIISSIKDVDIVSVPGLRECVKALADRRDRL